MSGAVINCRPSTAMPSPFRIPIFLLLAWLWCNSEVTAQTSSGGQHTPLIGLDHLPLAVRNLDSASATYRNLGFTLKAGRYHTNGIRNAHVKFRDSGGIELITAPDSVDRQTGTYRRLLADAEGPAFLALHAGDTSSMIRALSDGRFPFTREGEIFTTTDSSLSYLFFVRDNRSPTDRPEHFAHANGAVRLERVWVSTGHSLQLEHLLVSLGGKATATTVEAPDSITARVVSLANGEILILPENLQITRGRPIVGVTFRTRDLPALKERFSTDGITFRTTGTGSVERLFLPPGETHGIWMEFRQHR